MPLLIGISGKVTNLDLTPDLALIILGVFAIALLAAWFQK